MAGKEGEVEKAGLGEGCNKKGEAVTLPSSGVESIPASSSLRMKCDKHFILP